MLNFLTLILGCQLVGELFVVATRAPVPGPVVGMVVLFAGLLIRGRLPAGLGQVADAFLNNLSLLFVPAGVGVMLHVGLIGRDFAALSLALVASTLATIAVTALLMSRLGRGGGDA